MIHKEFHGKTISRRFRASGYDNSGQRVVETWTFSETMMSMMNRILPICSVDIRKKYDDNLPNYITKRVLKNHRNSVNYKLSDITRNFRNRYVRTDNYYLTNENIGYDDILIFVNQSKEINSCESEQNHAKSQHITPSGKLSYI